ncbi:hypothetical protein O3G_MSEX001589 [Manduca sexta]|uniref:Uncharacterized protein n=1 Tax=Manduca sexta TaxID=7130 RepID=A0A922CCP3_MANSE|nr:hypothetical protein O3G_MSEX001589 [Manduca sexta]
MQADYPKKIPRIHWDLVHLNYPVRKFPETGFSSETIGHRWRDQPEVIKTNVEPLEEMKNYLRDYNVTKELTQSQTKLDYGFKLPETKRFNKHTSCTENLYIYPPSRRTADQPPRSSAHAKTEMQRCYTAPDVYPRLVTDKDQFKHPTTLPLDSLAIEQSWHNEIEPLDTTYDGYEKYLDPYLTSNRLYHRPYAADKLDKISCSKDIVTFYTFASVPWTRTPKPKVEEWRLPLSRPKSMYDREKFKQEFREIRTHNKLRAVPGTFRTESRDNYVKQTSRPESKIHNDEEEVRGYYQRAIANLQTNIREQHSVVNEKYFSENTQYGSRKPLCSVFDPYVEKNRRLEHKK